MTNIFFLTLFVSTIGISQIKTQKTGYFGKTFEVGTSLTYIWNDNYTLNHKEWTWHMNAKMRLSNRFWTGIQILSIFQEQFTGR